jgi:DNA repair protein RecO (recombination protein O)
MRQLRTQAIILNRTDYAEADRIISFLTPDYGKLKAIAKGVRKPKSKLAGGIELFSTSDISFIPGRREISTVVSTRLIKYYVNIVKNLNATNTAYELIKRLDKATEDNPESAYFHLLQDAFEALDDPKIEPELVNLWFSMQLLRLSGHTPNLRTDDKNQKLSAEKKYHFDFEKMCFTADGRGKFSAGHIKLLRLGFSPNSAKSLSRITGTPKLTADTLPTVRAIAQNYLNF